VIQSLIAKYGPYDPVVAYLVKPKDHWLAVPGTDPTANLTCCARITANRRQVETHGRCLIVMAVIRDKPGHRLRAAIHALRR
jgi:hypothetical protein